MPDDKKLVQEFNKGSQDALCQIYQLYKKDMYGLAMSLLRNAAQAEDAVQDVFVSFAKMSGRLKLKGSIRNYLLTSVANRAKDFWRLSSQNDVSLDETAALTEADFSPEQYAIAMEEYKHLQEVLSKIPFDQREVILLRLHYEMTFKEIACAQRVSINTIQARYRYGMEKLGELLKRDNNNEQLQTNRRLDSAKQA